MDVLCMTYLEGNVCLRANFGWRQLHVGILPDEVDCDELLALLSSKAGEAAADGLLVCHDALGTILALVVIAGARLQQNHRRRSFTEKSTVESKENSSLICHSFCKEGSIFRCWCTTTAVQSLWDSSTTCQLCCVKAIQHNAIQKSPRWVWMSQLEYWKQFVLHFALVI